MSGDDHITTTLCSQDNDVCNSSNNNTHYSYYDRFIPCSNDISIETDVPGYYNYVDIHNNNNYNINDMNLKQQHGTVIDNSTITMTTTTKRRINEQQQQQSQSQQQQLNGPICWKCHGIGIIHKKKNKKKKKKNDSNDINNMNDNHNTNDDNDNNDLNFCCPICHGIGRIVMIPNKNKEQHKHNNNKKMNEILQLIEQYNHNNPNHHHNISLSSSNQQNDHNNEQQQWLMVTKGRRHDSQRNQHNNNNNTIDPKPYGYSIPIYGKQIQYNATQQYNDFIIPLKQRQQYNIEEELGEKQSIIVTPPLWLQPLKSSSSSKIECNVVNDNKDIKKDDNHNDNQTIVDDNDNNIVIIQLCNLVGEYRILQKFASHRYTTDDMMTAYIASKVLYNYYHNQQQQLKQQQERHVTEKMNDNNTDNTKYHYLDLGTGNGSVMLMVLWSSIQMKKKYHITHYQSSSNKNMCDDDSSIITNVIGIEARYEAIQLARRSIEFNLGPQPKLLNIQTIHSDFRSYFLDHVINNDTNNNNNNDSEYTDNNNNTRSSNSEDGDHTHRISHDNNNKTKNKDIVLYDLITGTPPYFRVEFEMMTTTNEEDKQQSQHDNKSKLDPKHITDDASMNIINMNASKTIVKSAVIRQGGMPIRSIQSAPARCEFRGGIESYCYIASQMLKPDVGRFIVCNNYLNHTRSLQAFDMYHLLLHQIYYIHGKKNKPILFCVYVASKSSSSIIVPTTIRIDEDVIPSDDISQQQHDKDHNLNHSTSTWKQSTSIEEISISVRDENGHYTTEYKEQVLHHFSIYPPPNT